MASPASTSRVLLTLFLLVALTASGAVATNVVVVNNCPYKVWPAATPVGGGVMLHQGQRWPFIVATGTSGVSMWGRTGCAFEGNHVLHCEVSGEPATLAELTVGKAVDHFGISAVEGFNVPMAFSSVTEGRTIRCMDRDCPDGGSYSGAAKIYRCRGNSDYQVTFCP